VSGSMGCLRVGLKFLFLEGRIHSLAGAKWPLSPLLTDLRAAYRSWFCGTVYTRQEKAAIRRPAGSKDYRDINSIPIALRKLAVGEVSPNIGDS